MIDAIGGRKVIVALLMALAGLGLVIWKGDIPSGLLQLMQTIFAAFIAGNMVEHYTDTKMPSEGNQSATEVDLSGIEDRLDKVEQLQQQSAAGISTLQKAVSHIIDKAGLDK